MLAAYKGSLTNVRSLCDWHAGLEVQCVSGRTALHFTSGRGHTDCARELIARGADVNVGTIHGYTPL